MRDEMDDQQLVEIRQLLHYTYGVTKEGQEALEIARRLMREVDVLRGNRDRLRVREAALVEIVEAVANMGLEYHDEHLEFFCPGCQAFVGADWGSGRKPHGLTNREWAEHRIKHEPDCPITKARALLAPGAAAAEDEDVGQ